MTVREFALAASDPKELRISVGCTSFDLINEFDGKLDELLLDLIGDYIIDGFGAKEEYKYYAWIREVPVKKEATA